MRKLYFLIVIFFNSTTLIYSQLLLKENFLYPDNSNLTSNGWKAHSSAGTNPVKVLDDGLTYPFNYSTISNGIGNAIKLQISGEDVNKTFGAVSSGTIYFHFYLNVASASSDGDYIIHLGPSVIDTVFRARVFVKRFGTDAYQIGISKTGRNAVYSSFSVKYNTVIGFVASYKFNSVSNTDDIVSLGFYNLDMPDIVTGAGELDTKVDIGTIALRQGSAATSPVVTIDAIRVALDKESIFMTPTEKGIMWSDYKPTVFPSTTIGKPSNIITQVIGARRGLTSSDTIVITPPEGFELVKNLGQGNFIYLPQEKRVGNNTDDNLVIYRLTAKKPGFFKGKLRLEIKGAEPLTANVEGLVEDTVKVRNIAATKKLPTRSSVTINGRVSATTINDLIYVEDGSGGIPVSTIRGIFDDPKKTIPKVEIGDSVHVQAFTSVRSTQIQLDSISDFLVINSSKRIIVPKIISVENIALNEGNLVSVSNLSFVDKKFVFLPNTNYTLQPVATIRVWSNTDISGRIKPQGNVTVTAVVGRFNGAYQLYPRSKEDIPGSAIFVNSNSAIPLDKTLDISTWNLYWFGSLLNGPKDEALQQNNVKRALDSLKSDIYVLQEVANPSAFISLVQKMNGYKGICSSAISAGGIADDAQRVCFLYKENVVSLVSTRPLLKNTVPIATYPESFDRFWASGRLPFLFVCDATVNGVKRRLNLVGIHARANTATAVVDKERIFLQRKIDVEVLKDSLDKFFGDESVILLGDFNDDVDENVVTGISTKESSYKKFVDDTKNWVIASKTLSDNGYRSYISQDNVIDHIVFSNELSSSYLDNSINTHLPFIYIPNYTSTTSDHIPVLARFQFPAIPLAIDEIIQYKLNVYPNPSNGYLNLELDESLNNQGIAVVVSNALGRILFKENRLFSEINEHLNNKIKDFSSGIYFVSVSNGRDFRKTFKVIIHK